MVVLYIIGGLVVLAVFAAGIAWLVEKFGNRIATTDTTNNEKE